MPMAAGRTCWGASGRPRPSQGHPRARPDASGAPTPTPGIDRPRPILPYVANICFKRFRGMLQLFHMDVAKVDRICCICCKCFIGMLQAFLQNVSSVPDVCCKRFGIDMFHTYVATVCSKCFICFSHVLQ
jgi:hypothetical protein